MKQWIQSHKVLSVVIACALVIVIALAIILPITLGGKSDKAEIISAKTVVMSGDKGTLTVGADTETFAFGDEFKLSKGATLIIHDSAMNTLPSTTVTLKTGVNKYSVEVRPQNGDPLKSHFYEIVITRGE